MNQIARIPIELLDQISRSRKYQSLNIPPETITSLYLQEKAKKIKEKETIASIKTKLHNIVALYLDSLDYFQAMQWLDDLPDPPDTDVLREICQRILSHHSSTRERLICLPGFYKEIFNITGQPEVVIDLACGLNPFFIPWMDLGDSTKYHAIDLHQPRVDLINHFFSIMGLSELAIHGDFLIHPPQIQADIVLLLKEAHRLEQRQKGCTRSLLCSLRANWLIISLPTRNLSGKHSMITKHRMLINNMIGDLQWEVEEIIFSNEIVFCIRKCNS